MSKLLVASQAMRIAFLESQVKRLEQENIALNQRELDRIKCNQLFATVNKLVGMGKGKQGKLL